jgi:hypothetical protein
MSEIQVSGLPTRKYACVLPARAASGRITTSSVSRAVKRASEASRREFTEPQLPRSGYSVPRLIDPAYGARDLERGP